MFKAKMKSGEVVEFSPDDLENFLEKNKDLIEVQHFTPRGKRRSFKGLLIQDI